MDEHKRVQLLTRLKKAYLAFYRQASVDDVNRKVKISEMIRLDQYPTYTEVSSSFEKLQDIVMSDHFLAKSRLSNSEYIDLVAFVGFGLTKRCIIRPGALTKMAIKEFESPVDKGEDYVLVHCRGNIQFKTSLSNMLIFFRSEG